MAVFGVDFDVGDPDEGFLVSVGVRLFAFEDMETPVAVRDAIAPGIVETGRVSADGRSILGGELFQRIEFFHNRGQGTVFEGDDEAPVVGLTERKCGFVAVEGVEENAKCEARKAGFDRREEASDGFLFTVLLVVAFALASAGKVFEELGAHREGEAVSGDQFGLTNGSIIERAAVLGGLREAALGEGGWVIAEKEVSGHVHGQQVVVVQEAKLLQTPGFQETSDHGGGDIHQG